MKTVTISGVSVTGSRFSARKRGYQAEITVDGKTICKNFRDEMYVAPWVDAFCRDYPFVEKG